MSTTNTLEALAGAIARMEGFTVAGSRSARNNNPGNLRDVRNSRGEWSIWPALPHDDQGFVVFPSAAAGWEALKRDLSIKAARGWTLEKIISVWAPASDGNNTAAYISNVSKWTGMPAAAVVQSWSGAGSPTPAAAGGGWGIEVALQSSDDAILAAAAVAVVSVAFLVV